MKARKGQIAIYLAMVLVAICVLAVMNVGIFLVVRAKGRAIAGGDATALAVAKYQGELLNGIGAMNVDHLKAALENDASKCEEIMRRQLRSCFLDPLKGLEIGSKMALENRMGGCKDDQDDKWKMLMRQHVADIRTFYVNNPETFPEPWDGAWNEFATELELQLDRRLHAWPANAEFADMWESFPLASPDFYQAIAGRAWCWFKFNGMWLFERDADHMPLPDFTHADTIFNSEIYSLHLTFREFVPQELDEEWTNVVMRMTGCTEADIAASVLITNVTQKWAFYDSRWNSWSAYDGIAFHPDEFPIVGEVKPEYDVLGCASICQVMTGARDLFASDERSNGVVWLAAAKPFGTVEDEEGSLVAVTALKRLVFPAFETVRLVPVDSVGGGYTNTADADWLAHVKYHIPSSPHYNHRTYAEQSASGCWYCSQLLLWNQPSFRSQGVEWLKKHSSDCVRPVGSGGSRGGTPHAG